MTAVGGSTLGVTRRTLLELAAVVLVAGGANAAWQAWSAASALRPSLLSVPASSLAMLA